MSSDEQRLEREAAGAPGRAVCSAEPRLAVPAPAPQEPSPPSSAAADGAPIPTGMPTIPVSGGVTPRLTLGRAARWARFHWLYPRFGAMLYPRRPLPPEEGEPQRRPIARLDEFAARAVGVCPERAAALLTVAEMMAHRQALSLYRLPARRGRPTGEALPESDDPLRDTTLHYFDEAPALLAAYRMTGRAELLDALLDRVSDWIARTTPGQRVAWEPVSLSRRLPHWCLLYSDARRWARIAGKDCPEETVLPTSAQPLAPSVSFAERLAASIQQQANFLARNLERDAGGASLIRSAGALTWCAAALPHAPEAPCWHQSGLSILAEELERQIRPDGGHRESGLGGHLLLLQDLLEAALALRDSLGHQPSELWEPLGRMLEALAVVMMPDGSLPPFDASSLPCGWTACELLALGAALFERGEWKAVATEGVGRNGLRDQAFRRSGVQPLGDRPLTPDAQHLLPKVSEGGAILWWLGEAGLSGYRELRPLPLTRRFQILPQTGCVVFRHSGVQAFRRSEEEGDGAPLPALQRQPEVLVLDGGPLGTTVETGGAPTGSLSFVYYAAGAARIADPGVGAGPAWDSLPSTTVSPTERPDGCHGGRSRRGERTEAVVQFWEETPGREQVLVSHPSHRRVRGRPVRRRRVRRVGREWRIEDEFTGRGRHPVELRFHLPGAVVAADCEGARAEYADGWRLRLRVAGWGTPEASVEPGWFAPDGQPAAPCPVLIYRWRARLPFRVETTFEIGRPVRVGGDKRALAGIQTGTDRIEGEHDP